MTRVLCALFALFGALLGCAKFPTGGQEFFTKRLHFTIEMNAPINPNYVYIVAINDGDDLTGSQGGPIPVIAPPWGNGFVAGKCTHFVSYGAFQGGPGYLLYKFTDENLLTYVQVGLPVSYVIPDAESNRLEFEIDLSQLRPPPEDANEIKALQINILTMDRVPAADDTNPKFWDAFGLSTDPNSINDYITIDVRVDRIYSNSDLNIEPEGDVQDPSLDIVDWQIEIRSP